MVGNNPSPQIDGTLPQDRAETLELVFRHLPPDDRQRQISQALGDMPTQNSEPVPGLFGARRNGRLVGAMFSQIHSGRTAIVWPPRLTPGEPEPTAAELFAATWRFFARHRVILAHALLPTADKFGQSLLNAGGMRHLTNLLYLVSENDRFPSAPPPTSFDFESYREASHDRFARIIEATYEGTRDCPSLNGVRSPVDVLAGYRSAGVFDPQRWLITRHNRCDVGCLLMADHPRHENMELLYLGLIPGARGRGWGRRLVRHAQWVARLVGRPRVVVAVDAANAPAIQTYMATDFQAWQRRRLYVRQIPPADDWHASFRQVIHDSRPAEDENLSAARVAS